jgi:hypothetical protein
MSSAVASQILSWLPPLVFTILNENGIPMALGLASLDIYFLLGIFYLVRIGNYESAVSESTATPNDYVAAEEVETHELL